MVIQSFLPVLGGAQRQVDLLAPLLQERGVDVTVVTRRPPGTPARELRHGMEVRRMPGKDKGPVASVGYSAFGTATLAALRPDVIHVHDLLSPATIGLLGGALTHAPVVAKVLSTGPGGDVDRLLTKPFGTTRLRMIGRRFAAFICLSGEVRAELAAHDLAPKKLRAIPNGVDVDHFRPPTADERRRIRVEHGISTEGTVGLFSGRFDAVKRVEILIEAIARTADARLVLVGEGPCLTDLRTLATRLGVADRVVFLTRVDDPAPLYRLADVYLSASATEGMSNSMLEAMASGLPVFSTEASGTTELITQATGVVVPDSGAAAALAVEIERLDADQERAARLGTAGRELAEQRFSLPSVADRLVALYEEISPNSARSTVA